MSSYQQLLQQLVQRDLPSLQAAWTQVQQTLATDPQNDPCNGVGGPASLVPQLQQISDWACAITHDAARAALGYTFNCNGIGAQSTNNAQNATTQACSLRYYWPGPNWGPYGTSYVSGSNPAVCLDSSFLNAVGAQVGAATYAVEQAQATMQMCLAAAPSASKTSASAASIPKPKPHPIFRRGPHMSPNIFAGVGLLPDLHPPVGVGRPPSGHLGQTPTPVPPSSVTSTPDYVSAGLTIQPCQEVYLKVYPIPQGVVTSDPTNVLTSVGFSIVSLAAQADGGSFVHAVWNKAQPYSSNPQDANYVVYSGEAANLNEVQIMPFSVGETITGQSSGVTAVVAGVVDDLGSGTGSLSLSSVSGPFQNGETIKGSSSGNSATVFQYGAVINGGFAGLLGVTEATLLKTAATASGPCALHLLGPGGIRLVTHATGPTGPAIGTSSGATGGAGAAAPGMSTAAIVALSALGLAVVGGAAWYFMKARKPAASYEMMMPYEAMAPYQMPRSRSRRRRPRR